MPERRDSGAASELREIAKQFRADVPAVDDWSLRLVHDRYQSLTVRQGVLQPTENGLGSGAHITVIDRGGVGYGATGDLSSGGLRAAMERATGWARQSAARALVPAEAMPRPQHTGGYRSTVTTPWHSMSLGDVISLLHEVSGRLKIHDRIVDWQALLSNREAEVLFINSTGSDIQQSFSYLTSWLAALANRDAESQQRTHGGWRAARQGGLEQLQALGFSEQAERVAEEALALLDAPNCPSDTMDVLLTPSQMILQVHESIGHPLELDRILGDERNYAGTSFVTPDMFGSYRYGSEQLNVTFDPGVEEELASYAYDDEGTLAEHQYLIRDGILLRPLGGALSQARSALPGVANARACSWNRPPIDRMANLNVEPGDKDLDTLIGSIERGVLMDTNRSWSIDDSRNKFQFGCEYARLIEDGMLKGVVKNPNYRGISATFWRSLDDVGDQSTFRVLSVSNCGKGEPNQVIDVGHASPACVFRNVDVFGGN